MKAAPYGRVSRWLKLWAAVVGVGMACCALATSVAAAGPLQSLATRTVTIRDGAVPLAGGTKVYTPVSGETETYKGGGATVDASNSSEGYVMIKYEGSSSKIKVQIARSGGTAYTYDLNSSGKYEVFPLTSGNGTYKIGVFTNVSGNQYAQALNTSISVSLRDSMLPFLYPSQYVNFNAKSRTVAVGQELAAGAQSDLAIIQNIYNYVTQNISYDTGKAQQAASGQMSGYLPRVDDIIASGKGICFDYAAVMTAMLRSQQIPTRMEVGYVSGGAYHAWISTYVKEVGWVNGIIQFDGKSWKLMDPTFAASTGSDSALVQYIGDGSGYKTQYIY